MVKKNSVKKFSWPKKFWGKKILSQKNFGLIDLNPKFVLSKEKTGRVNPRWRIYDPPPQKIVGLKLCWIVVSFAW